MIPKKLVLELAKGFRGRSKNCISIARERVEKALQYAYRSVTRINQCVNMPIVLFHHFWLPVFHHSSPQRSPRAPEGLAVAMDPTDQRW